ncbi:hypothetical protein BJ1_gp57 [Halorubrum virus BJ1]|uniref:Uncharacterized protein n=1 Tax=Halorubrum virus BJ1 TaxID=416419 RepID=A0ZYS0_9CAUD|nr:hypothetical protein BJ1_gp57 [Halorubrum virus BJ1]CAL92479.1 hypothetical protein [Halorubrum virus BJ1]
MTDDQDEKPDLADMGSNRDVDIDDVDDGAVTTESDYRWRWLSTIYALAYGLGVPAWVLYHGTADVGAVWSSALALAWGSVVVYIVGPENVRAWRELRGSDAGGNG